MFNINSKVPNAEIFSRTLLGHGFSQRPIRRRLDRKHDCRDSHFVSITNGELFTKKIYY